MFTYLQLLRVNKAGEYISAPTNITLQQQRCYVDYFISSMNPIWPIPFPAWVKPLIPLLTPLHIHLWVLIQPGQTFFMLLASFWQPTGSTRLLFPGPQTPGLQRQVANIIKSQPAARRRWEIGGGGKGLEGRNAPFQPSPDTFIWQSSQCPANQSPIKYSITLFSNFCPLSALGAQGPR